MPLHHFNVRIPEEKLEDVVAFLTASLKHLGFKEIMRPMSNIVGMGESVPYLWLAGVCFDGMSTDALEGQMKWTHVAFSAKDIKQVRQFYDAGLQAGGIDNGKPGRRPQYAKTYYGAFVRDPACGINWEVCFIGCPEDDETLRILEQEAEASLI